MIQTCKVIATYIGPRPVRVKKARQRRGIRLQDLGTADKVLDLLTNVWDLEARIDPGLPMDTYLICNGGYPEEHAGFFYEIDGAKTPGGIMRVIQRENTGLSFGAYAHAFDKLRDRYEYWLFSEDDVVQTRSGYLPVYREALGVDSVGFVATVGVANYHGDKHVHGGCGFADREILNQVAKQYGGFLPYAKIEPTFERGRRSGKPIFNHGPFCKQGEVPLTNSIYRMGHGFKLITAYTEAYYEWRQREISSG